MLESALRCEHKRCCVEAMALTGARLAPTLHVSPAASPPLPRSARHQLRRSLAAGFNLQLSRQEPGRVRTVASVRAMAGSGTAGSRVEENLGVRIERDPSEARLDELGIRSWPKFVSEILISPRIFKQLRYLDD